MGIEPTDDALPGMGVEDAHLRTTVYSTATAVARWVAHELWGPVHGQRGFQLLCVPSVAVFHVEQGKRIRTA
jgi:hypothetical protein